MGQIGSEVGQDQHWAPGICVRSLLLPVLGLPYVIRMCLSLLVHVHGSGGLISVRRMGLCMTIGVAMCLWIYSPSCVWWLGGG